MKELKVNFEQTYLVTIISNFSGMPLITVVPNRNMLARFMALLNEEAYTLSEVYPLSCTVDFNDLMEKLTDENKPIGMETGNH
jgi:hypothetical protein